MNRRTSAALSPPAIRSPRRVLDSRLARANTTHSPISEPAAATPTTTGIGSEPPPSDVAARSNDDLTGQHRHDAVDERSAEHNEHQQPPRHDSIVSDRSAANNRGCP